MKMPFLHRWRGRKSSDSTATPKALILMYHRVAEPATDPWSLSVAPRHFEEHLQVLRRLAQPVKIGDLARSLDRGLKGRLAAITFDDGYSDNFYCAKPLLEQYDVPASIFFATGFLGSDREFWWDELDRIFLQPGRLPATLQFDLREGAQVRELGDAAEYAPAEFKRRRAWKADEPPPTARQDVYRSVWQTLQRIPAVEQDAALDQMRAWSSIAPQCRQGNRPMTYYETAAMGKCELIEAGAHSVTHPVLSLFPASSQQVEIETSKRRVEEIVGHPVQSFAFPYGDHNADTVAILKAHGFTNACSTAPASVQNGADPFACLACTSQTGLETSSSGASRSGSTNEQPSRAPECAPGTRY